MDWQMPEMNGIDAIIAIRNEFPDARIIVLTTYSGDVQILRALKAGARAYLLKNSLHKELLETIRAVHEPDSSVFSCCWLIVDDFETVRFSVLLWPLVLTRCCGRHVSAPTDASAVATRFRMRTRLYSAQGG